MKLEELRQLAKTRTDNRHQFLSALWDHTDALLDVVEAAKEGHTHEEDRNKCILCIRLAKLEKIK